MGGISPGVVVILAAFGLIFVIFAIWAVYTQVLPSMRHLDRPVITAPQTYQIPDPKHHRIELRRSLYSNTTTPSLFREPRNDISDYDLKNSRYSTNALDFSRPPSPDSQRLRRGSQSQSRPHSQSRSRSRSRPRSRHQGASLAELRTSLYSDPNVLLSADARSSYFNLVIDQPDAIASATARPRPKSLHHERPTSTRSRSRSQKRRSAPAVDESQYMLPITPFADAQGSNNASSVDLATLTSGPYKHIATSLSATNFLRSSRHSLPDLERNASPHNTKCSPFGNTSGANTPGGFSLTSSRTNPSPTTPADREMPEPEWPLTTPPKFDRVGSANSLPTVAAVEKVYEGRIRAGRSRTQTPVKPNVERLLPRDVSPGVTTTAKTPLVASVEVEELDV
ncbi:hypothetical protein EDD36DRAFT_461006 [Exophiala viscosa]|uniref:Uncharacterized protein n=1 Tax=Exophiala viscosa TaxID=2486360 RepID=A0AAN6E2W0_9EURO|nr:hypothetical protein EDD36DRAFT_461006 [Exophiala viscosa]